MSSAFCSASTCCFTAWDGRASASGCRRAAERARGPSLEIGDVRMTKWVYSFSAESAEGRGEMKNLLGGKGANLHDMASLGLPVPPGFTITAEVCTFFYANGKTYPADLGPQVDAAVAEVGRQTGRAFGDPANPLLLSVRSGARASMPGMMDTVLNLGLNDEAVETLAKTS